MSENVRVRSLSNTNNNSMRAQYAPLSDLDGGHSPSGSGRGFLGKNGFASRLWRLPRKWLLLGFTMSFCLVVLFGFRNHPSSTLSGDHATAMSLYTDSQLSETISSPISTSSPTTITVTTPLLGKHEDQSKLYFPASIDRPIFSPPIQHYNIISSHRPRTPLFIGFTRNNDMLLQCLISYLAAGWPPSDIIIVDNSGTMDANSLGLLSPSNPFHLDYRTIRSRYGVSILQTPTFLSFSQLQNFYLRTAMSHSWPIYFWSHMDIAVLSYESATPYQSFYSRILSILADHGIVGPDPDTYTVASNWGLRYFTYDWLTLINVQAWRTIGAWDTFIPYYAADCDAYSRIAMHGLEQSDVRAGLIYDLASVIDDPESVFFPQNHVSNPNSNSGNEEELDSPRYKALKADLEERMKAKDLGHRNEWQSGKGNGGKGEPWTYDPKGFQKLWWDTAEFGRGVYKKKWGSGECRLADFGVGLGDEFRNT